MSRLFGTDGVRGVAGKELDRSLAVALGRAAVRKIGPKVLIGRDSRKSGPVLEAALTAGIAAESGHAVTCGVIPTPAIALLVREAGFDCGIVISASHNPPEYNGIKFFDAQGFKLPDALEDEMQAFVGQVRGEDVAVCEPAERMEDAAERYVAHAVGAIEAQGISLKGLKVALDCAHGAACSTTPAALEALGAEVVSINADPDGALINVDCGSTHLEPVTALLRESGADIAIAHDGDADRMLAVAPDGTVVDGDFILAMCAHDMKKRDALPANMVVSTVMANIGFTQAMERDGIEFEHTKVGDRYVLERMRETGAALGGEQSGHVIFLEHNTTGDGLMTALQLLAVMARYSDKGLPELMGVIERFPQSLVNVRVTDKALYEGNEAIAQAEAAAVAELGDDGRLLVRASGTEPLIRVMVEARTQQHADSVAEQVAAVVREQIGA